MSLVPTLLDVPHAVFDALHIQLFMSPVISYVLYIIVLPNCRNLWHMSEAGFMPRFLKILFTSPVQDTDSVQYSLCTDSIV